MLLLLLESKVRTGSELSPSAPVSVCKLDFTEATAQMPSDSLMPDEFPRAVAVVLGLALAFALSLLVLYAFNVPG
jgi:hypothetical protein